MRSLRPLFLKDALLVSFLPPRVEEGHLRVEEGRILEVGRQARPRGGDEIVDRWGKPVLPGLVNADHRLLAAASGVRFPPREDFTGIVREPEILHALAGLSLLEALSCGTTTVVHHPDGAALSAEGLEGVALACREVGLRGVLGVPFAEGGEALETVRRFQSENVDPGVRLAFCVRAAEARAGAERLVAARGETGLPLHVDLRGPAPEAEAALASLEEAGLLRGGAVLFGPAKETAHGVRRALASGARLAVAPRAEASRREGPSLLEALGAGIALGTGGIDGDLFEEARFAAVQAVAEGKAFDPVPFFETGWEIARSAFDLPFGSLAEGAPADLLFVDAIPVQPLRPETLGTFLLGLSSRCVEAVYVAGRRLHHRREPMLPIEREALLDRARAALAGT